MQNHEVSFCECTPDQIEEALEALEFLIQDMDANDFCLHDDRNGYQVYPEAILIAFNDRVSEWRGLQRIVSLFDRLTKQIAEKKGLDPKKVYLNSTNGYTEIPF